MKSKEFIVDKLNYLYSIFNDIKIRYEYRSNTFSHLIEIIPLSFFEKNEEYMAIESEIEEEFESKFLDENILFISEESLSEIINPEFKLGYDEIKFNNVALSINFVIKGYNVNDDIYNSNNYALAA